MNEHAAKGRRLEAAVAEHLAGHGYAVRTNVVLEGRSGSSHEIDVLAEKADSLTTFRVAVECKAWAERMEKDVVAKFAYVLGDLGITKGIIASGGGWRIGAEHAANQLGVELWGPEELADRLGAPVLEAVTTDVASRGAAGLPFGVAPDAARRAVLAEARGALGISRERTAWLAPLWVPAWCLRLAVGREEGRLRRVVRTTRRWHAYEGLTGELVRTWAAPPPFEEVDLSTGAVTPVLKDRVVAGELRDTHRRWGEVTTEAARARHAERLARLGLDQPAALLAVEDASLVWLPTYAALLTKGDRERIVAVDGLDGRLHPTLGAVLTAQSDAVCQSVATVGARRR